MTAEGVSRLSDKTGFHNDREEAEVRAFSHITIMFALMLLIPTVFGAETNGAEFKQMQLRHSRVAESYRKKESDVKSRFEKAGVDYPPYEVLIRVFKRNWVLELWARSTKDSVFKPVHSYEICATSGKLGPKRREGDKQVPEGYYHISKFNPVSDYYLSLQINYPNKSDRILGYKDDPGSLIFIHGNCVTIGCIPITDEYIKELYIAAVEARNNGQEQIPVQIFPSRMDNKSYERLKADFPDKELHKFWDNIKVGYDYFEKHRKLPTFRIDEQGRYVFK